MYFSSLKFLKQLEIEQKKKSRLRELLLLVTRILLICMLVLAFAHPVFPGKSDSQGASQTVGIYLDNSQSMENEADGQSLFNHAKRYAIQTVRNYPQDTRFYLLHNEELFTSKFPLESNEMISKIELLKPSSRSTNLGQVLRRFAQIMDENSNPGNQILHIFSDLQQSFIKPESVPDTLKFTTKIMGLPHGNTNNLYIDSCWFLSPVQNAEKRQTIHARINNSSDRELQRFPVSLLIRDSLVAQETVSLSPYSTSELQFSYNMEQSGWQKGIIEIRDYPVSFDNRFYFVYHISDDIPVLQIFSDQENFNLRALFESDPYFDYSQTKAEALPYQDLKRFRFIVLNSVTDFSRNLSDLLTDYVKQGGTMLVIPPENGIMTNLNRFLQKLEAPVISNLLERTSEARIPDHMKTFYEQISLNPSQRVEWPKYNKYYRVITDNSLATNLLTNETGRPLLSRVAFGKGYITVSASPLTAEYTNFQVHPLFIPFLYYLANSGVEDQELYSRIGRIAPISVDNETAPQKWPVRVTAANDTYDAIPNQFRNPNSGRLMLHLTDYSGPAGILNVSREDGPEALLAMNYARDESQVDIVTMDEIQQMILQFGWKNINMVEDNISIDSDNSIRNNSKAFSIIRILLLLAIISLLLESLIHRFKT